MPKSLLSLRRTAHCQSKTRCSCSSNMQHGQCTYSRCLHSYARLLHAICVHPHISAAVTRMYSACTTCGACVAIASLLTALIAEAVKGPTCVIAWLLCSWRVHLLSSLRLQHQGPISLTCTDKVIKCMRRSGIEHLQPAVFFILLMIYERVVVKPAPRRTAALLLPLVLRKSRPACLGIQLEVGLRSMHSARSRSVRDQIGSHCRQQLQHRGWCWRAAVAG